MIKCGGSQSSEGKSLPYLRGSPIVWAVPTLKAFQSKIQKFKVRSLAVSKGARPRFLGLG